MTTFQTVILGLSLSWVPSVLLVAVLLWLNDSKRAMKSRLRAD
jgi:hypothetical protein